MVPGQAAAELEAVDAQQFRRRGLIVAAPLQSAEQVLPLDLVETWPAHTPYFALGA